MENEATLLIWTAAGLMISDMLETAENKPNEVYDHHEDAKLFQDKFHNDKKVQRNVRKFGKLIFRARTAASLYHVNYQKVIESVKCAKYIGNHQFKSFVRERLIEGTSSLYNTTKKNFLALYCQKIV